MLSLTELKKQHSLEDLTQKFIESNENYNELIKQKVTLKKVLDKAKIDLFNLEYEHENVLLPNTINQYLLSLRDITEPFRVTASIIDKAVLSNEAVQNSLKGIKLNKLALLQLESQMQLLDLEIDAAKRTDDRLDSIAKTEGLGKKIKYGLTKIDVDDYLKDNDGK